MGNQFYPLMAGKLFKFTDIESTKSRQIPNAITGFLKCCAVSPDGKYYAAAGEDGRVSILDLETLKMIGYFHSNVSVILAIDFSPDGKQLLISGADGSIRIWNLFTNLMPIPTPTPILKP